MLGLLGIILHLFAIYIGAQIAPLEYVDIWRCVTVGLVSYVAMLLTGLVLVPLLFVPVISLLVGTAVLLAGTAIAAKVVLSCDWQPAWTIAITVSIAHALFGLLFH